MLSTQERIDQMESPIARELCQGLADAVAEAMWIPNDLLPEEFQQEKTFEVGSCGQDSGKVYGSSVADINRKIAAKDAKNAPKELTPVELDRIARSERVEKYIDQLAGPDDAQLTFIEDEIRLHRAQVTFLNLMVQQGVLDEEDFEEE